MLTYLHVCTIHSPIKLLVLAISLGQFKMSGGVMKHNVNIKILNFIRTTPVGKRPWNAQQKQTGKEF